MHPTSPTLIVLSNFLFQTLVACSSTFSFNCTTPPADTNYVAKPKYRGTLQILWDCLSIIILCTWTIQHLNVPANRALDPKPSWQRNAWWRIWDSRTQLRWMMLTILMPEYIMGKALNERLAANWAFQELKKWNEEGAREFEEIHGYFANMGGYYLDFSHLRPKKKGKRTTATMAELASQVQDSGFENYPLSRTNLINLSRLGHDCWALNFHQLKEAKRKNLLKTSALPKVSPRDLEGLSKSDALVKFLAIVQVSWLMIQLLVRKLTHLPSSQLEIVVLAFAASSFVTYITLWDRPRGIERRYRIPASKLPSLSHLQAVMRAGPDYLWTWQRKEEKLDAEYSVSPIPNDAIHHIGTSGFLRDDAVLNFQVGTVFSGILFGSLHLIAWNFEFPSQIEKDLWRVCSIVTTVVPVLSMIPNYFYAKYSYLPEKGEAVRRRLMGVVLLVVFALPYMVARGFIMVEIIRSLFFLPPKAFVDTWSVNFPHWG